MLECTTVVQDEFNYLKDHLSTWPEAVPADMLCDERSEDAKVERAKSILEEFIGRAGNVGKLNVLDFGCGEGHVAKLAADLGARVSVGYDLSVPILESGGAYIATTDWQEVLNHAPYDLVLLYDVLDHLDDPRDAMASVGSISKFTTIVAVRCHPWCARHGGHLYKSLNKAYAHLIFSAEELQAMQLFPVGGHRVLSPLSEYGSVFRDAGMKVAYQHVHSVPQEEWFCSDHVVSSRFKRSGVTKMNAEIAFVDYKLFIECDSQMRDA